MQVMEMEHTEQEKLALLDIYERYKSGETSEDLKRKVDFILEKLFRNPYGYTVPMNFINSEIGRTLFKIKLDIEETTIYGATEIAIVGNLTRSWVNRAFQTGLIQGEMAGGRYFAREYAVVFFLTKSIAKPLSEKECKEKLQIMKELKRKGESVQKMKEVFNFQKSLMHRS